MSKPKKLNMPLEKLKEIAKEINNNTIANRNRIKEEKIPTDIFIKRFGILRKDFSETIKGTSITYNKSTFLYNIGEEETIKNTNVEEVNVMEVTTNNNKVTKDKNNQSNNKVTKSNNIDVIKVLKEQLPEVLEVVKLYKDGLITKDNFKKDIEIDRGKLNGELQVRSFKTYKEVLNEFSNFCKDRKETQQDLLAIALLDLMGNYK